MLIHCELRRRRTGSVTKSIISWLLIVMWPGASVCWSGDDTPPPPPRVVLLRTTGDDVFIARLRAELAIWNWEVEEIGEPTATGDVPLANVAVMNGAWAAVRFQRRPAEAEIWTDSLPTGASVHIGVNNAGAKIESVLAVVAAEQLRSRLSSTTAPPPTDTVAPSSTANAVPPPAAQDLVVVPPVVAENRERSIWMAATSGASAGAGGLGPAPHLMASAGASLGRAWSVDMLASLPLAANQLTVPEGTARISPFVFGAGLERAAFGPLWHLDLAGGVGIAWVIVRGQTNDEIIFDGHRADLVLPLAWARLAVTRQLTRRWRVRGDALLAATAQPAIIQIVDRPAARWGQPVLMLSVGVELAVRLPDRLSTSPKH